MPRPPRPRGVLLLAACLLLPCLAACRSAGLSGNRDIPKTVDAAGVREALQQARLCLLVENGEEALDWMQATREATGIPLAERDEIQRITEQGADLLLQQCSTPGSDPERLLPLLDLNLPRQITVNAGMRAATLQYEQDELEDAFETIKRVDRLYPTHHLRAQAAYLLAELGLRLSYDDWHFLFFTSPRDHGEDALEYFVLNYPARPRGDEAYWRLAEMYEEDGLWDLAIGRQEELILEHPSSGLLPESRARIPHLRLESISSPEYDRGALERARSELDVWLLDYPGHTLEPTVSADLADCLRRLSESDLTISAFYARIDNPGGARYHAARAMEEARRAGDPGRQDRAREILDTTPEPPDPEGE